jgi:exonuclease SbcC
VVRIGIERGIIIEARVVAQGSPKVSFKLFVPGDANPKHEQKGVQGNPPPDFVREALRITKADGMEIQLGMQKEPIFLLGQGGPALAKVLSVGRESGFLTAMRERHRTWTRRDNDLVAKGEAELMGLNRKISVLEELQGIEPLMQLVRKLLDEVESTEKAKLAVSALVQRMSGYEAEIKKMSSKMDVLSGLPSAVPVLQPLGQLERLIDRIAVAEKTASLKVDVVWPEIPTLTDNGLIIELGRKIGSLEKVVRAGELLPTVQVTAPELTLTTDLVRLASSMARLTKEEAEMARDLKQLESEIAEVNVQQDALKESLGGVCPLCGNLMNAHQH